MAYCNLNDIKSRIPEKVLINITQDDKAIEEINEERVNAAILDADALFDSKIGTRYEVPLETVPDRIKRISIDLAVYFMYKARFDTKMPETVKLSYDDAISYLNDIRDANENISGLELKYEYSVLTNQTRRDKYYSKRTLRRI
ncbi:MAG: DUF1320 domain-containing protein [Ignavibacteria bacterium]|nr:DUF1320 domain-containing protein [Ignavibacteria bacterium]